MTLDPKYSSLPWLATGQPDVYETADLTEVDQTFSTAAYGEDSSDNIDNPTLNVKDGVKQFKDKELTINQKSDFSDSLNVNKGVSQDEEEEEDEEGAPQKRKQQSMVERYERVMREITELKADLASGGDQPASADQPITLNQLKELVAALETQIKQHKLDQFLGSDAKALNLDVEASITKELSNQVNRLQSEEKPSGKAAKPNRHEEAKQTRSLVYELYHSDELEKKENLNKLSALSERLARLERVVGSSGDVSKISAMTANTTHKSLLEAASKMSQAAALLDGPQLDQLESRLTTLTNRLNQMAERRDAEMDSDTQNRVAALYTLVKKHEKTVDLFPSIVERVTALKSLHHDALLVSQNLSRLDSRQQLLSQAVRSHCSLLDNMEEGLTKNLEILQRNADSLNERLTALGK